LSKLEKVLDSGKAWSVRKKTPRTRTALSHHWVDMVDLKMCRRIAQKVRKNPSLMKIPRSNLRRWRRKLGYWPPALREWEKILEENPIERVLRILTQDNDDGQRLRQSDPFVGILTESERRRFLKLNEKTAA
jgi:hypothetical protein